MRASRITCLVKGYPDGTFHPDEPVTRAQFPVLLAKALMLSAATGTATGFADDGAIPAWVKGAVEALRREGLADGRGGNRFVPNETDTRAEAVIMLLRMLEHRDNK